MGIEKKAPIDVDFNFALLVADSRIWPALVG